MMYDYNPYARMGSLGYDFGQSTTPPSGGAPYGPVMGQYYDAQGNPGSYIDLGYGSQSTGYQPGYTKPDDTGFFT